MVKRSLILSRCLEKQFNSVSYLIHSIQTLLLKILNTLITTTVIRVLINETFYTAVLLRIDIIICHVVDIHVDAVADFVYK